MTNDTTPPAHEHCFHGSGYGTSTLLMGCGNSGSESGTCCHCGTRMTRAWHDEKRPIEGHGPHATECVRVYDEPRTV